MNKQDRNQIVEQIVRNMLLHVSDNIREYVQPHLSEGDDLEEQEKAVYDAILSIVKPSENRS